MKAKRKTKPAAWKEVSRRAVGLYLGAALTGGAYVHRIYDVTEYCRATDEYRVRRECGKCVYSRYVHRDSYAPTAEQRLALVAIGPLWEQLERACDAADGGGR